MMAAGQPIGFYLSVQSTARPIAGLQGTAITVLVANNPKLALGNANAVPDHASATGAATFSSWPQWLFWKFLWWVALEKAVKMPISSRKHMTRRHVISKKRTWQTSEPWAS
jgi:hypothetical protein